MSASELVDIVDAADRVIGTTTRADMRARRLRHRAAYILVLNGAGELFVHQRSPDKDVFPGYWDCAVGGVVGAGESYDDCARRELAEEVGISGVTPEPLFAFTWGDYVNGYVYRVTWDGPLVLQAEEIVRGEWLPLATVRARMASEPFCPDGIDVFARAFPALPGEGRSA